MGGQVFISYRHTHPDETVAETLDGHLHSRGLAVFRDTRIEVGRRWVAEIVRQIRASRFFVILLSKDSIKSDMVRQEIKLAHELEQDGKMRILPIRLGFTGALPYDFAAYLDPIQYALWQPPEPVDPLCELIADAIENELDLPTTAQDDTASEQGEDDAQEGPLPAADPRIFMETGTLRLDSPFYIERPADQRMSSILRRRDRQMLVIKGTRQSGKSSLLTRAHALAHSLGRKSAHLDLQLIDRDRFASLDTLFRTLAFGISTELGSPVKPADVWDEDLGAKGSFSLFVEQVMLTPAEEPVLLCLDEVDRVFEHSYRDDFFATLRGWYNKGATNPLWDRLHLALAHATDPALWIRDLHQSPFNVGERLELRGFSTDEFAELNRRHGSPLRAPDELLACHELIGGQPYLARQALYVLHSNTWSFKDLQKRSIEDSGPFGDHLRGRLWALHRSPGMADILKRAMVSGVVEDEMDFQCLLAAGLISGEKRHAVRAFCELYRDYFRQHL